MFFNTRQIALQRVSPSPFLELDVPTTLSYYIIDPGLELSLATIEYKLEKLSGRSTTEILGWTSLDLTGITDDLYNIDITLPAASVKVSDNVQLVLRITDTDGIEHYHKDQEVSPI